MLAIRSWMMEPLSNKNLVPWLNEIEQVLT